ncbi:MAG TPA: phasin family protein [Aromatoleum sp.]|uniref:phasin family protein n=1 Tax=Aromatoleum sp. TaxID=2307007 RepID=UPI002B46AD50|nr:phasin family protein [Aromatoleum sp.]HJV27985.1 phasin family protein [Aromatoleum sp.]
MTITPDTLAASIKSALATSETAALSGFEAAERLAALNLNTARSLFEDGIAAVRALTAAKTPNDLVALQTALVQPAAEKAMTYFRSSYEIVAQGVEEAIKPFEAQYAELNKAVAEALEKAAKSAPVGSEVAVAAVQSAIAAANSAYDNLNKATRKVVAITEANVAATAKAAAQAVTPPTAKKTA